MHKLFKAVTASTIAIFSTLSFAETTVVPKQCSEDSTYQWASLKEASEKLDSTLASGQISDAGKLLDAYVEWSDALKRSAVQLDMYFNPRDGITVVEMVDSFIREHVVIGGYKPEIQPEVLYTTGKLDLTDTPYREVTTRFTIFQRSGNEQSAQFTIDESSIKRCEEAIRCTGRTPTKTTACNIIAEAWQKAANSTTDTIATEEAIAVAKYAIEYEKDWDKFHRSSRYQYPWEKGIQAWHFKDELSGNMFVKPPAYQIFFIRPWFALEYINKADDGSQFKVAGVMEWVGFNNWKSCKLFGVEWFDLACGISGVTTFSDRAGADDVGHGVMLHLDNKFSFGATRHSDEIGFFISVDLLKAIQEKGENVEYWQKMAKSYLGAK
ncbi:hypothetical protein ACPV5O_05015 [Vibrio maritimus]|uniref:hypothetical protein n=1 Tax=Vibrio maritimus TaxID=990268 RepID=UPI004068C066